MRWHTKHQNKPTKKICNLILELSPNFEIRRFYDEKRHYNVEIRLREERWLVVVVDL